MAHVVIPSIDRYVGLQQDASVMRFTALCSLAILLAPGIVVAQQDTVTRRDGFLRIWESIYRPTTVQLYPEFDDVPKGDRGFTEISYAAERKLLDNDQFFHPEDALTKGTAALWLLRMRNVEELDAMEEEHLPELLERYPIIDIADRYELVGDMQELNDMILRLNTLLYEEVHEISFYAENFHGKGTAFGETFDMNAMTAAHLRFPHNTLLRVTNLDNDTQVTVRVNDRGPYVHGRSLDLSLAAFLQLTERSAGVLRNVRIERLGDVSLVSRCGSDAPRFQRRITRDVRFHRGVPHTLALGDDLGLDSTRFFVVRTVTYPDGNTVRLERWIAPGIRFQFTPSMEGEYTFRIGTGFGRERTFTMHVVACN